MKLGFIGAGEMGGAIIRGLLKAGWKKENFLVSVHTPASAQRLTHAFGLTVYTDNIAVITQADLLFLAVKPAQMPEVLEQITQTKVSAKPLISMALGWSVEKIQHLLPAWPVARIMPNTPLSLGEGVTLFHFSPEMIQPVRNEIKKLFETMGKVVEVDPSLFEAATALSGSGPAFVYAFIEALTQAGVSLGMTEQQAVKLAVQTVIGAAKMVEKESVSPAELVRKVATPGGCTAAGMDVLAKSDFKQVIADTLAATAHKAKEACK